MLKLKKKNNNIVNELEFNADEIKSLNEKEEESETVELMEDFFQTTLDDIERFNEMSWKTKSGYIFPNYEIMTNNLEGLSNGLFIFAGCSNHGKSAIMMNLMYDACSYKENKLFGLYFSLDDSKNEIIPRIIAMDQKIPIGSVSKPGRYMDMIEEEEEKEKEGYTGESESKAPLYREYLKKREIGLDNLRENNNKFKVIDSNNIKNIADMEEYIEKLLTYLRAIDEDFNILIAIDSINDITLGYRPADDDRVGEIAKRVKSWTVKYECPVFASSHIRKLNSNRRPALDDMYDSTVLAYEATTIFLVYNDVSANKEGATIYQTVQGDDFKQPILELDWAKNKASTYKGRTFCFFRPEYSSTIECDEESNKRYNALLYEAM